MDGLWTEILALGQGPNGLVVIAALVWLGAGPGALSACLQVYGQKRLQAAQAQVCPMESWGMEDTNPRRFFYVVVEDGGHTYCLNACPPDHYRSCTIQRLCGRHCWPHGAFVRAWEHWGSLGQGYFCWRLCLWQLRRGRLDR